MKNFAKDMERMVRHLKPQKPQRQKNIIDTRKQEKSIMDKFMSTENVAQTDTETK